MKKSFGLLVLGSPDPTRYSADMGTEFLTRLGEDSRMVVTGDPSQTDLPGGQRSGLNDAVDTLKNVEGVRFIRLTSQDVVRHDLVTRIVEAYDARDKKAKPDNR